MKTIKGLQKDVPEIIHWEALQPTSEIVVMGGVNKKKSHSEKKKIERAIGRNWTLHNSDIGVKVSDNVITLSGIVNSWREKDEAERIAHNAPGIWTINNELIIENDFSLAD